LVTEASAMAQRVYTYLARKGYNNLPAHQYDLAGAELVAGQR
jgi:hypothetical protein